MLSEKREKWPAAVSNTCKPEVHAVLQPGEVALTFVNHATFLIQTHGLNILTDPVWSKRVGPVSWFGPARVRPPGIDFDALPPIHLVLISHNHYDHLDRATLKRISARFSPRFLVPWGNRKLLQSAGAREIVEFDWWQTLDLSAGCGITFAPTQHWSKRGLFDRQKSLWGSFMVSAGGRRIYFGGDSAYSSHFADIRRRLGAPDLALLGIGAYEPRWFMQTMHMNPAEAVAAHRDLGARESIGMHFGTFRLSAEGMDHPPEDLKTAVAAAGLPDTAFTTLQVGETRFYRASA
jgi:L-ascorbate metabolism protein UlaG (beta-lactamase superfamily)